MPPPSRQRHRPQPQRCNATLPSQRATALAAEPLRQPVVAWPDFHGTFLYRASGHWSLKTRDPPGPSSLTRKPRGGSINPGTDVAGGLDFRVKKEREVGAWFSIDRGHATPRIVASNARTT
ncbi:hypothetical protein K0M31_003064 [Melipona bicolor]|uniref:Uncharacterized protein n=1 Tax=Melipona bicolor TaxID=60889 RepID=A0AA40G072_9HYME|nr:hypothetical protein K0M31_003064 [Melipona bicolor]